MTAILNFYYRNKREREKKQIFASKVQKGCLGVLKTLKLLLDNGYRQDTSKIRCLAKTLKTFVRADYKLIEGCLVPKIATIVADSGIRVIFVVFKRQPNLKTG